MVCDASIGPSVGRWILVSRDQPRQCEDGAGIRPSTARTRKRGSYRILYLYMQAYATVCLVLVFGKGDKENISKADTNALAERAGGLKAWAKVRHEEWLRQIQEH